MTSEKEYWDANLSIANDPNEYFFRFQEAVRHELFGPRQPGRAIEIGPGGEGFPALRGVDVVADLSLSAARSVQQNLGTPSLVADAGSLPLSSASFDQVYTCDVMHHTKEGPGLERVSAEIKRVLKPGGRWFVSDRRPWWGNSLLLFASAMARRLVVRLMSLRKTTIRFSGSENEPPMTEADFASITAGMQVVRRIRWRTPVYFLCFGSFQFIRLALGQQSAARLAQRLVRITAAAEGFCPDWLKADECLILQKPNEDVP